MAQKGGGSYAILLGPHAIFAVEFPLILAEFHAARTAIAWHILGACFLRFRWRSAISNRAIFPARILFPPFLGQKALS